MKKTILLVFCMLFFSVYAEAKTVTSNNPSVLKGHIVNIPEGSTFSAKMQSNINSESLKKGDTVSATLTKDWVYEGEMIAPKGSILYGEAIEVEPAGITYKSGRFELKFNEIITPDGEKIKLASNTYVLAVDMSRPLKIAGNILCGAIIGVVVGAIYTAASGGNVVMGLMIGAGAGLCCGAVFALAQTGENVELPRNTPINILLVEPVKVNVTDS